MRERNESDEREVLVETLKGVFRMRVSIKGGSIRFSGGVTNLTTGRRSFLGPPLGLIKDSQLREAYRLDIQVEKGLL